jgi:hypothetical protein
MRTYVCLLFVNGLIQVTPKAIHTYVHHHDRNGLGHIQSDDDTADIINPSQDTACILRSLEVVHVELVLG